MMKPTDIGLCLALLVVVVFLWRETKKWFRFLDGRNTPVYQEGEEEDRDS